MNATQTNTARYPGSGEPTLREMLADPTFVSVLRRDGLTPAAFCRELGLALPHPENDPGLAAIAA